MTESFAWVEQLGITIDLRLDAFALVMVALVSGIGLLICVYSLGYFSHDKPGLARLAGVLTLFAGAMLGVVLSDQLIALFIFWELTSVTSYLLIGNDDTNPRARAAALQAIFITGAGGLAMLAGLIIIGQAGGTYRISELLVDPPSGAVVNAGLVLVLIGAFTKSAQAPFSSWLPAAMVAPTPVSAYLHSATMVKAGVYLVARLAPMFALTGSWRGLVLVVGATTMLVGGLRALRQHDLKLLLAYGTVSQLGFMMLLFGVGDYHIAEAGIVLILAHGAFKAALFMVVGIVDHETGTRDIRELHGFSSATRVARRQGRRGDQRCVDGRTPAVVRLHRKGEGARRVRRVRRFRRRHRRARRDRAGVDPHVRLLGSLRAGHLRFVRRTRSHRSCRSMLTRRRRCSSARRSCCRSPRCCSGSRPVLVDGLIEAATTTLYPGSEPKPVELFAGFNTALLLSAVIIACGIALTVLRAPVADLQSRASHGLRAVPSTEQGFLAVLRSISVVSTRVTATVQNGSLPIYLAVIMLTVTIVPLAAFASELDQLPQFVETPAHVALVAIMVAAGLGACIVRHRIAAALMLGAVGYAMAGLYVAQGAPDLALTQFSIETLSTVLFVLVLRFLPRSWRHRAPAIAAPMRIAVAGAIGVAVFVFALSASNARSDVDEPSMSEVMIENSLPKGKGANVVNVILVDFRGWDTMGEITVLLVAAIGAVSLARPGRRRDDSDAPVFEEILDVGDETKLPEALR